MAIKVDISASCPNFAQRYADRMREVQNVIYLTPSQARYFGDFDGFEAEEAFSEKRMAFIDYVNSYVQDLFNEAKHKLQPEELIAECKPLTKREVKAIYYWALRAFDEIFERREPLLALIDSWYDLSSGPFGQSGSNPFACELERDKKIFVREAIVDLCDQLDSSFFSLENDFIDFKAKVFQAQLSELDSLEERTVVLCSLAYSCIQMIGFENPKGEFFKFLKQYVENIKEIDSDFSFEELHKIYCLGLQAFEQIFENAFLEEIESLNNRIPDERVFSLVRFSNKLMSSMKTDSELHSIHVPDNDSNAAFFKNQFRGIDRRYGMVLKEQAIAFFAHLFEALSFVENDEQSCIFHRFLDVFLMKMKIPYKKSSSLLFNMPCEGGHDVRSIYYYWLERVFEDATNMRGRFSKMIDANVDDGCLSVANAGQIQRVVHKLKEVPAKDKVEAFIERLKGYPIKPKMQEFLCKCFVEEMLMRDSCLRK